MLALGRAYRTEEVGTRGIGQKSVEWRGLMLNGLPVAAQERAEENYARLGSVLWFLGYVAF